MKLISMSVNCMLHFECRLYINFMMLPSVTSQTEQVEEDEEESEDEDTDTDKDEDEDAKVEEEDEDKKSKKTVDKTVWDWVLINENKPLWTKK